MQADSGSGVAGGGLVLRQVGDSGTGAQTQTIQVDADGQIIGGDGTHTITFTDGDGNLITCPVSGGAAADALLSGVTVVPSDALGPQFLSPVTLDGVSLKLEPVDGGGGPGGQIVSPIVLTTAGDAFAGAGTGGQQQQVEVLVASSPIKGEVVDENPARGTRGPGVPESEKKICLWPTGNGTTCGKSFAKFDSLKRHLTEAHKGVRPYACKLCDKSYGRRDYLQRHLKSHNATYAVNLAGGNAATLQSYNQAAKAVKIEMENQNSQANRQNQTVSNSVASMPLLNLYTMHNQQQPKPMGSKICRWVQDDGTVCGKAFSKLDSLRRHVNELHKGVRPFACTLCDKNYGRKDYLDRHIKTHDPANGKRKPPPLDWGTTTGVANLLECIKEDPKPKNPDQIRKKRRDIPADEKKICLWVLDDGTACGKTFTKFDSLKRHVAESHKNVRPFCCTLCGKTYGRRDYLLRHLRSHNESDLANLATQAQLKEAEQMGQLVTTSPGGTTGSVLVTAGDNSILGSLSEAVGGPAGSPLKTTSNPGTQPTTVITTTGSPGEISQVINSLSSSPSEDPPLAGTLRGTTGTMGPQAGKGSLVQVLTSSGNIATLTSTKQFLGGGSSSGGMMLSGSELIGGHQNTPNNSNTPHGMLKPHGMDIKSIGGGGRRTNDKKTCRWVLDNGTICGRSFSKFDSLRRHVQELHKGVRPFACNLCEKTYGRKDYLERHIKSHTAKVDGVEGVGGPVADDPVGDGGKLMSAHGLDLTSGAVISLGDDDDDLMGGDVVAVVGAVDDEDDDLTV